MAHVDYPSHRTKLTHECLAGLTLQIDQVVRDIAAALVQKIDHVDVTIADQGENIAQHPWAVSVGYRNSRAGGSLKLNRREVDRVADIAVLKEGFDLIRGHHGAILFSFGCAGADMWHQDSIRSLPQQGVRKVGDVTAQFLGK